MTDAVLLVSHGTVERLEDLEAFVTRVRHGRAAPAEVVAELRRRYEAIGGRSPLNDVSEALARKLAARLGVRVEWAARLWKPAVRDVLAALAREGVRRAAVVPLAQHSAHVYAEDARRAAEGTGLELACARNWGQEAKLCAAYARRIVEALGDGDRSRTTVVMTAHSLPRAVVERGDPYEREVRAAAASIAKLAGDVKWTLSFQSQGMSDVASARPAGERTLTEKSGGWLGPDIRTTLDEVARRGDEAVVLAPVGFLADHVETLYDLDVEAAAMARERGLRFARARSLDADDDLIEVLADVARPLLGHA